MSGVLLPFAVLLLCAVPWLLLVGRRFGHVIGVLAVITVGPLLVLVSFHLSQPIAADPVAVTLLAAGAVGAVGAVLLVIRRGVATRPSRTAVATWLPACTGLAAWLGTLLIAPLVGGSVRGWAMFGDAANNIAISRGMLDGHGYPFTAIQAVPLPNELLAIGMWTARHGSGGELLAHDLYALAVMGALAIGSTGIAIGAVATSLLPAARARTIAIVGALASLASATWLVAGLPMESGYYNVHLVLPFALASWLAYLQSRRHPIAAGLLLVGLTLVIAASWIPLVVVPVGLGFTLLLRLRRSAQGVWRLLPSLIVLAVVVAVAAGVALHSSSIDDFRFLLSSPGHGFPSTIPALLVGAAGCIAAAVIAHRRALGDWRDGTIGLSAATLAGLGLLLAVNLSAAEPWNAYYPAKYAWLVTLVALAVLLALVVRLLAASRAPLLGPVAAVAVAVLLATLGPAPHRENFHIEQPLARILSDGVLTRGESSIDTIIEYADSAEIIVQWGTGVPDEAFVNFWALEFKGTAPNIPGNEGRYYTVTFYRELRDTGTFVTPPPERLCGLVRTLADSAVVHTRDRGLAAALDSSCPEIDFTVIIDPALEP